jgi:hypothetical protein
MSMYLIFFGKSQDFTIRYYDRNQPIRDFNSVIKDFDLLESKVFTVDDIKNKEILSRYFFTAQGRNFCLLKLYSFAQAYSGNRIAGSIYGVGLLSDKCINLTKDNLELLRAAKVNFAKLSLDGYKFNKSNFQEDTERIWKAIITNSNGNLLDTVNTTELKINNSNGQVAFYVNNLFDDAIKLNGRIDNQDTIYLSEDLDHLKRTQNKWGKDSFPVYWEQGNQFVIYKEPVIPKPAESGTMRGEIPQSSNHNDFGKLKAELEDCKYINRNLQNDLEKIQQKRKIQTYIIYSLAGIVILMLLYMFFLPGRKEEEEINQQPSLETPVTNITQAKEPLSNFLIDIKSVDSGIVFFNACKYVYSFDAKVSISDTAKLHKTFRGIEKTAKYNNINIDNITESYNFKCQDIKNFTQKNNKPNSTPIDSSTSTHQNVSN